MSVPQPAEVTLIRPTRLWVVDTVAIIVGCALIIGARTVAFPYDSLGPALYLVGVIVALALLQLLRRPRVTLRATGITVGRREIPWSVVTAVDDHAGLRARQVRVFRSDQRKWVRLRALRTSRILPSAWYVRSLSTVGDWAKAHAHSVDILHESRGPVWIYPVAASVVLGLPLYYQDPVHFWFGGPTVTSIGPPCGPELAPNFTTRVQGASPLRFDANACALTGPRGQVNIDAFTLPRSGLVNGAGVAHRIFDLCEFPYLVELGKVAPPVGPVPADEVSTSGYADGRGRHEGTYLLARKADMILMIAYSAHGAAPPRWTCDGYKTGLYTGLGFGGYRLDTANTDEITVLTEVANRFLSGTTVG